MKTRVLRTLAVLGLLLPLAGCAVSVDPDEDPGHRVDVANWQVILQLGTMKVTGDCDGGISGDGEFAYQLGYARQQPDGSWPKEPVVMDQSGNYPDRSGTRIKMGTGDELKIGGRTTVVMKSGDKYRVEFRAIEWDVNSHDQRMNGKVMRVEETVGTAGIGAYKDVKLKSGNSECGVEMIGVVNELREGGLDENWE